MSKKKNTFTIIPTNDNKTMNWARGEFSQQAKFQFTIPYQFLMLCKLTGTSPKEMLTDFMNNLSQGSWKTEGRNEARELLKAYFLAHHYGLEYYSKEEISIIFEELTAIGKLFPRNASSSFLDLHTVWRDQYHKYWFEKWYRKRKQ